MKRAITIASLLILCATVMASPSGGADSHQQTKEILARCIAALGGMERLRNVETISYQSFEHTFIHAADISESLPEVIIYTRYDVALQLRRQTLSVKSNSWTSESADQNSSLLRRRRQTAATHRRQILFSNRYASGKSYYGFVGRRRFARSERGSTNGRELRDLVSSVGLRTTSEDDARYQQEQRVVAMAGS
jgi:hypothetical protein